MALRTYWCVLTRKRITSVRQRVVFDRVADEFSCELDLDLSYMVRAAFLTGLMQHGGEDADRGEYRMDVYDDPGCSQIALSGFIVPPDSIIGQPGDSLAGFTDDQLLSEMAWRLRQR